VAPVRIESNPHGPQTDRRHRVARWGVGSVSFWACSGALSGCKASCSSSLQNTERDGRPAHVLKAQGSGGNMLAHARPRAEEVPEFIVTAENPSR
jgi:hypothetical protein